MKTSKIIIFILIVAAFVAGVYFKDDARKFYNNLNFAGNDSIDTLLSAYL